MNIIREEQAAIERFMKNEYWRLRHDGRFAHSRASSGQVDQANGDVLVRGQEPDAA